MKETIIRFFSNDRFPSWIFVGCSTCEKTGHTFNKGEKKICWNCNGYGEGFYQSNWPKDEWFNDLLFWIQEYIGYGITYIRYILRGKKPLNYEYEHDKHYYCNEVHDSRPYVSGFHMAVDTYFWNYKEGKDIGYEFTIKDNPYEEEDEAYIKWRRGFEKGQERFDIMNDKLTL